MCGLLHVAGKSFFSINSCQTGSREGSGPRDPTKPRLQPKHKAGGDCVGLSFSTGSSDKLSSFPRRMRGVEPRDQLNPAQQWESGEKYRPVAVGPWYVTQHPVPCTLGPPIPSPCSAPHSFKGMAEISPRAGTALLTVVLSLTAERKKPPDDQQPPLSWSVPQGREDALHRATARSAGVKHPVNLTGLHATW